MTIWIGEIQWMIRHGLGYRRDPILRPLHHIETRDALLDLSDPANPREAEWPEAEFIVGNPPFLGDKLMLGQLGADYVALLRSTFDGRLPGGSDLCCYFLEKARDGIVRDMTQSCRSPRYSGRPRWRKPASSGADQGVRRHLLCPIR